MFIVNILTIIFSGLAALEHFYILFLETIITTSSKISKVFNIPEENLKDKHVSTLLKNQGVYNGLLAGLLIYAVYSQNLLWSRLLLGYVILVALFGAWSSNPKILIKQGGLAIIALLVTFL